LDESLEGLDLGGDGLFDFVAFAGGEEEVGFQEERTSMAAAGLTLRRSCV
jgi:hypothetical protein